MKMQPSGVVLRGLRSQLGMTLIEVLVALAVFAIVGISVLGSINQSIVGQQKVEETTLGLWIADNELTELKLKGIWPETSWQTKVVKFAQRDWHVRWQGVSTPQPQLRALDIEVSLTPFKPDVTPDVVARLRTYVGRQG